VQACVQLLLLLLLEGGLPSVTHNLWQCASDLKSAM
jgi:hypothetical protein